MLKNINKFSKLTIAFTGLYILIGVFIMSDMRLGVFNSLSWIILPLYIGFMLVSVIMGIIAVIQTNKADGKGKWIMFLLTLINIIVLVLNIIAVVIFPRTF